MSEVPAEFALRERILRRFAGSAPRHELADWRLLGVDAEGSRRLARHFPPDPVPAAVLMPLVDRPEGLTVLLTQRSNDMPSHPGQISFPGGKVDDCDADPLACAIREAHEEIGLTPDLVEPLGYLDSYRTGTGFQINPVVGLVTPGFDPVLDPREVLEVFEVPLAFLMDPDNHQKASREWRGRERFFYAMPYQGRYIWGATAGMLKNMHQRLFQR